LTLSLDDRGRADPRIQRTALGDRAGHSVDVDDAFIALITFDNGAVGTLEASRLAIGRLNHLVFELNGSQGSLTFDLERLNELRLCIDAGATTGFQAVNVTDPNHPFMERWWPPGHIIGWEHTFVHEIHHLLSAIRNQGQIRPHGPPGGSPLPRLTALRRSPAPARHPKRALRLGHG
jgi:predicted dehydrogenase